MALVQDLPQVAAVRVVEHGEPPFVDCQDVDFGELLEQLAEAPVSTSNAQLVEQARQADLVRAIALSARLVGQRTCEPGLADTSRAGQQYVLFFRLNNTLSRPRAWR